MATIEPRLIHLLNENATTPRLTHVELPSHSELPPIQVLKFPSSLSRPLPIEPDANQGGEKPEQNGGQLGSKSIPSFYALTEDSSAASLLRKEDGSLPERTPARHISSQDLRKILDDAPDNAEDTSTKKRPVKEDFVQLPQPLKKQKSAQSVFPPAFPPIIVGLLEPPLNAALFPPISSGGFVERHTEAPSTASSQPSTSTKVPLDPISSAPEEQAGSSPPADLEKPPIGKAKRRAAKPRRKWTEEETNHLLLGVSKHGVGRWTDILDDPEYNFNERTAGDLKDRFRTCCPDELRQKSSESGERVVDVRPRKGLMSENILNEPEEPIEPEKPPSVNNDSDSAPRQRKSRAHRKKLEDLAELGIKGPFKKSHRRERRPFSDQDDQAILRGFELYGPQWTKIQRDPRFNLSSRQPTDLRDRLRNKYPEKFASSEKQIIPAKDASKSDFLEPSVNIAIENTLGMSKSAVLEPPLNRINSKEDMPKWPYPSLVESGDAPQNPPHGIFWGDVAAAHLQSAGIGEMDISRLLLDDSQVYSDNSPLEKRGSG